MVAAKAVLMGNFRAKASLKGKITISFNKLCKRTPLSPKSIYIAIDDLSENTLVGSHNLAHAKTWANKHERYSINKDGSITLSEEHLNHLLAADSSHNMIVAGYGEGFTISEKGRFSDNMKKIAEKIEKHQQETDEFPFPLP